MALMDLLLQHGADVNARVTGTKTYSLRISRAPSATEGMSALHVAAQRGRADLVRYLLEKGANPELVDSDGRKAIDLAGAGGAEGAQAPAAAAPQVVAAPASAAEIRNLLQNAASHR